MPENLISQDEVPDYAGLIYITDIYPYFKIIKQSPRINKDKVDISKLNLTDKFYYNMITWRNRCVKDYQERINALKKELNECKIGENGKKYKYTIAEANERLELIEGELEYRQNISDKLASYLEEADNENRMLKKILKDNNINYTL